MSQQQEDQGLVINKDHYNSIRLDTEKQSFNIDDEFQSRIEAAMDYWTQEGIRALSVKISLRHSAVVPICQKLGFDFHHAQPGYVLMTKWLPKHDPNTFPEYANQYLGVAGFVVNEKNQVLVIQERYNIGKTHWKLPGGLADKGEDIAVTAQREVLEETGVEAEFVSVIAFRHQHKFRFGCSDFYFICLMKAVTQEVKPCPREIARCQWMNIDEYERDPTLTDANRFFVQCYRQQLQLGTTITPTSVLSYNKKFQHHIYSIQTLQKADHDDEEKVVFSEATT